MKRRLAYKNDPKVRARKRRALVQRKLRQESPPKVAEPEMVSTSEVDGEITSAKTFSDLKKLAAKYNVPGRSRYKAVDRDKLEKAIREAASS